MHKSSKTDSSDEKNAIVSSSRCFPSPMDRLKRAQLDVEIITRKDLEKDLFRQKNSSDIVKSAYRIILRRLASDAEIDYYKNFLKQYDLLAFIGEIHYSPEGKTKGLQIQGLKPIFLIHRAKKILKKLTGI